MASKSLFSSPHLGPFTEINSVSWNWSWPNPKPLTVVIIARMVYLLIFLDKLIFLVVQWPNRKMSSKKKIRNIFCQILTNTFYLFGFNNKWWHGEWVCVMNISFTFGQYFVWKYKSVSFSKLTKISRLQEFFHYTFWLPCIKDSFILG